MQEEADLNFGHERLAVRPVDPLRDRFEPRLLVVGVSLSRFGRSRRRRGAERETFKQLGYVPATGFSHRGRVPSEEIPQEERNEHEMVI